MVWINIILIVLLLSGELACFYLFHMIKRQGENFADILQNRMKEYESEKGRNLATKEDIGEITKQIETVRSEIDFESQRKRDFIVERKRHLLNILYYVEKIQYGRNRLMLYSHNYNDNQSLFRLNDEMNESLLELTHESHIVLAECEKIEGIEVLTRLVDDTAKMVSEIVLNSHNSAVTIASIQSHMKRAEQNSFDMGLSLNQAHSEMEVAEKYANEPIPSQELVENDLKDYMLWLNQLFASGLNFRYDICELKKAVEL